jgi:hypothetical protein
MVQIKISLIVIFVTEPDEQFLALFSHEINSNPISLGAAAATAVSAQLLLLLPLF